MPAFNIFPTSDTLPISGFSTSLFTTTVSQGSTSWQAAIIKNSGSQFMQFDVTGTGDSTLPGAVSVTGTSPIINALQIVNVVEFLQPAVLPSTLNNNTPPPMEYVGLPPGDYLLLHVHGAVNLGTNQPKYAGGWYSLTYSTNSSPSKLRVNYPELGRYTTGQAASSAYSGNRTYFSHAGGNIVLQYVNDSGGYSNISVTQDGSTTSQYIAHGLSYPAAITSTTDPIAPVFALISVTALNATTAYPEPVLFVPSAREFSNMGGVYNNQVSMWTKNGSGTIYYTTNGATPTHTTSGTNFQYSTPITLTGPTTIKAVVWDGTYYSPVSIITYS